MKGAIEADALVNASRDLLKNGDAVGAERVLSPVIDKYRSDAPVMHLMGQIKKAQSNLKEAERHFRAAIAHEFDNGNFFNDLGLVLQARSKNDEAIKVFRAAQALMPHVPMVRVNITRCLMAANNLAEAEAEARAYITAFPGPESWTLLGQVQRAQDRDEDALVSAQSALKYQPNLRGLRYNLATALDRVGRAKDAMEIYEDLAKQSVDSADLALNFSRALYADGRKKEAEEVATQAVAEWPGSTALHGIIARMRWLRGEGENCTALMEADIATRPRDMSLRLGCADALHRAHYPQKALKVLSDAIQLAPDTPALLTALGVVLDELDRPLDGLKALRRVVELSSGAPSARRNLLSTLLRAKMPDEALSIVHELQLSDPEDQYLIACEATALRMLGDPAYAHLFDYDRLVRTYEIPAPRGFFTAENFNASLSDVLRAQHRTNAHPLDQHLHNGTQTGRSLLSSDEVNIKAWMAAADVCVRDYITRLKPDDPVGGRRGKQYRYNSIWSVRLTDGGYQPNHVHDRGWISSAYYAALMPGEGVKDPHAGWLKFGEPNRAPLGCGAEKFIEPKVGLLVLFPSYMWHGTVPFEGSERLSAAFDVIPGDR